MYILFILFYAIWRMKLSLCSQQRDLHQLGCLLCMPRQYFTLLLQSMTPIMERTEERLTSTFHSRFIFPFWLFARGEGYIMTFLTTPDYLDSFLPSAQRSLKNKTSAKLLLLRSSQVAVLARSSLAYFSLSPLLSYTCSTRASKLLPTNTSDGKYATSDFIRICAIECEDRRNV